MKQLFLLFYLCVSFTAQARPSGDTTTPRFLVGISAFYSVPLGSFSWKQGGPLFTGACMPALSGEIDVLQCRVYRGLWMGFAAGAVTHRVNTDMVETQLHNRYQDAAYYTTVTINQPFFDMGWLAAKVSYAWRMKGFEARPGLFLGWASANAPYFENNYEVYRKRKQENYAETIYPTMSTTSFFYPGIGMQVSKKLWRCLWASAEARYCNGNMRYTLHENKRDYLGNTLPGKSDAFVQRVPVMQYHCAIQLRFGNKRLFG